MKSIDFKSLLIGILGTALVMTLMGFSHKEDESYFIRPCGKKWDIDGWTSKDEKGRRVCKYLMVFDVR